MISRYFCTYLYATYYVHVFLFKISELFMVICIVSLLRNILSYRTITSTDNAGIAWLTFGEGWHNYHHVFPWDYKAAEFGNCFNFTTNLIDFFAYLGLAYDLKTASPEIVKKRILRNSYKNEMSY